LLTYIDEIEILAILSIVEIGLGITAGSLCTLRPLLRKARERFGLQTIKTNRSNLSKTNKTDTYASGTKSSVINQSQKGESTFDNRIDDVEKRESLSSPKHNVAQHPDFLLSMNEDFQDEDVKSITSSEHIIMRNFTKTPRALH
jgi:hypothetical protein